MGFTIRTMDKTLQDREDVRAGERDASNQTSVWGNVGIRVK